MNKRHESRAPNMVRLACAVCGMIKQTESKGGRNSQHK
jgi:hypothetical protein